MVHTRKTSLVACVCVWIVLVGLAPLPASAYHQFDPITFVTSDIWLDSVPRVAVVDRETCCPRSITSYVYTVWWQRSPGSEYYNLMFRRHLDSGAGAWTEEAQDLAISRFGNPPNIPFQDIAISAYENYVHVAYSYFNFVTGKYMMLIQESSLWGAAGSWTTLNPFPDPASDFMSPDLAETDQAVYLVRVAVAFGEVRLVRLKPLPIMETTIMQYPPYIVASPTVTIQGTAGSAQGSRGWVAYQRRNPFDVTDVWEIEAREFFDNGDTLGAPVLLSPDDQVAALTPDLDSHGNYHHIVWREADTVLYLKGIFSSWDSNSRFAIGGGSSPHAAVAAYGHGVAVIYLDGGALSARRNTRNGEPAGWQVPELLDPGHLHSNLHDFHVAADTRWHVSGTKYNNVHYVWHREDLVTHQEDIAHRRIPTDEREVQAVELTYAGTAGIRGQSVVLEGPDSPQFSWVFGGEYDYPPTFTDRVWLFDPVGELEGTCQPQCQWLSIPKAYTSAIWEDIGPKRGAWIFGGLESTGPTFCVAFFDGAAVGPIDCTGAGLGWTARYGTSAVFDGVRYAYVFGGRTSSGYLAEVRKFDVELEQFVGWGVCPPPTLPTATAFMSAAWDPSQSVVYLFGGQTALGDYVNWQRFNPGASPCPAFDQGGTMPDQPWDASLRPGPGTTAAYGNGKIWVAGGRSTSPTPPLDFPYIYAFDPASQTFTLQLVDLPACKSFGSSFWSPANARLYHIGGHIGEPDYRGCGGGGRQVIRYEPAIH